MEKLIKIGDKEVGMRCSARTPFLYRRYFGKDIICEMQKMKTSTDLLDYSMFENLAWLMANDDKEVLDVNKDMAEWLEQFEMLDIYQAMPQIIELWDVSNRVTSKPAKK